MTCDFAVLHASLPPHNLASKSVASVGVEGFTVKELGRCIRR